MNFFPKTRGGRSCSADFQSAVSPSCTRQGVSFANGAGITARPEDYKSAVQQIENLRYEEGAGARQALLHFQSVTARHSRAFTGLFTT